MKANEYRRVNYLAFLIFVFSNFFTDYKRLCSVDGKVVYYRSYSRDFYIIKLLSKLVSILILIFMCIYPEVNIFQFTILNNINEIIRVFLEYISILLFCVLIILMSYSLKFKNIHFNYLKNNEDVPDKFMYAKHILNESNLLVASRKYIYSYSSDIKFRYEYPNRTMHILIINILIFLMLVIFFMPGPPSLFIQSIIIKGDYLRNKIIIVILIQTIILILSYLISRNYKIVKFIKE